MWLITHSLLSAWQYALKDIEGRDSLAELTAALQRQRIAPTDAMRKGTAFEEEVSASVGGKASENLAATHFAGLVRGGQEQVKLSRRMRIAGQDFLLYGIADWIRAGIIYDIKHTTHYDAGKYRESTQHPMYLELLPEAAMFTYLISSGAGIYMEQYTRDNTQPIARIIEQFSDWLLDNNKLRELYETHWRAS